MIALGAAFSLDLRVLGPPPEPFHWGFSTCH